jgi:hypothetical protein
MSGYVTAEYMVKKYLEEHGFDGLLSDNRDCACLLADLAPCGEMSGACIAGHREECDCGEHDFHVSAGKAIPESACGAIQILLERERQMSEEGFTPEHDAQHAPGDMACAAVSYAFEAVGCMGRWANFPRTPGGTGPAQWPWLRSWWKPSDDPVRNLVKAGALIAAEIDRLRKLRADELDSLRSPAPEGGAV